MKQTLTYQETLDYLYQQLPMFQRVGPMAFKKDLGNIVELCKKLSQPHRQFKSIHIAGTNGKGSTAHLLSSVLQTQGLKVGLYTSPHYRDFRERIKINGRFISKRKIIDFVKQHDKLFKEIKPSFFEITVAIAFDYFAKEKVDIAIIETGLGGRLDSTNIIQPLLSIITNISFDHQQLLGDTLVKIAGEKAGIIKTKTPVVIGEEQKETKKVFQKKALQKKADIVFASRFYKATLIKQTAEHSFFDISRKGKTYLKKLSVNLHGGYQQKNITTVLMALENLKKECDFVNFSEKDIREGFKNLRSLTRFMGRWQFIGRKPNILCDSAHNKAGLKTVFENIAQLKFKQLHFVLGVVNDKDIEGILALLPKEAKYYFAKAKIPRGLDAKVLKEKSATFGLEGRTYTSVKNALRAARRHAVEEDLIYVGGSTFVVAEVI